MATQQDILGWLARNPSATDRDIASVMNQYGVNAGDVAAATGIDPATAQRRYENANAQTFIQDQYSMPDAPWIGNAFREDGSYNFDNNQRNNWVLGAGRQMGYDDARIAEIVGLPAEAVTNYAQQHQPSIDIQQSIFAKDQGSGFFKTQPQTDGQPGQRTGSGFGPSPGPGWTLLADGWHPPRGGFVEDPTSTTPALGGPWQGTFSQMYGGYQASPWLSATADEIGRRTQDALGQAYNGIRSNAVGVGGLGGSRQGVAQGMATSNAIDSLQGNLANLFGQDYTNSMNRGLQARGQDQGFAIGLGGLANQRRGIETGYDLGLGNQYLNERGQDMGFYNANRGMDLQQLGLGAQVYDMGVKGGWAPLQTAGGLFNSTAGNNVTQTSGGTQGGGAMGLLGGLWGGAKFGKDMGFWG